MLDPDLFLTSLKQTHPRLLFYPSCGSSLLSCVLDLPYDVFVFCDYAPQTSRAKSEWWSEIEADARKTYLPLDKSPRHELSLKHSTDQTRVFQLGKKWGIVFFQDNNEVLERIIQSSFRLSAFVGIRDGCTEGSNYECVNELPFLGKALLASTPQMDYFTDHSSVLEDAEKSWNKIDHRYFHRSVSIREKESASFRFLLKDILWLSDTLSLHFLRQSPYIGITP